jgi:hypothetical protein
MNSDSLSKTRTRVGKQLVFLVVFALVVLAFVATPLTVFAACPNDNNGNTTGSGTDLGAVAGLAIQNNTGGTRDAVIQKYLDEIEQLRQKILELEQLQNSTRFASKITGNPTGAATQIAIAHTDTQIIAQLIKPASESGVKLVKLNGNPLKLSSINTVGQQFKIKVKVNSNVKTLAATYTGKGSVRVTLPGNQKVIVPLSNL